jgi:hypothetical protein
LLTSLALVILFLSIKMAEIQLLVI